MKDRYTRWDTIKAYALFVGALLLVGVIASLVLPENSGCYYFSQHATDC